MVPCQLGYATGACYHAVKLYARLGQIKSRVESGSDDPDNLGHLGNFLLVTWVSSVN